MQYRIESQEEPPSELEQTPWGRKRVEGCLKERASGYEMGAARPTELLTLIVCLELLALLS